MTGPGRSDATPAAVGASRLHADLAARILQRLHELRVGAGYHLVEADLRRAFGASRTPVRGALRLLAEQGARTGLRARATGHRAAAGGGP